MANREEISVRVKRKNATCFVQINPSEPAHTLKQIVTPLLDTQANVENLRLLFEDVGIPSHVTFTFF